MKLTDCYDATYARSYCHPLRPAITVKRAREIFAAAESKMNRNKLATVNKSLTVGQAFEILSGAVSPEDPGETVLDSLISRNIVREFGKFLDSPKAKQIKSLVEDSGYSPADAKALVDGGF